MSSYDTRAAEKSWHVGIKYQREAENYSPLDYMRNAFAGVAAAYYRRAVDADPRHAIAWHSLGEVSLDFLNEPEAAISAFEHWRDLVCASAEQDTSVKAEAKRLRLEVPFGCEFARAHSVAGRKQRAREYFDQATQALLASLNCQPVVPREVCFAAEELVKTGTYLSLHGAPELALDFFGLPARVMFQPDTVDPDPEEWSFEHASERISEIQADAFYRAGIALVCLGKKIEAERHLSTASAAYKGEDDGKDLFAWCQFHADLARAHKQAGRSAEAVAAAKQAVWAIRKCDEEMGNIIDISSFEDGLADVDPQHRKPSKKPIELPVEAVERYSSALALIREEKYQEAAGELILATREARGKFPDALHLLGLVYDALADYKRERQAYESALKVDPHHADSLKSLLLAEASIAAWAIQNNRRAWSDMASRAERSVQTTINRYEAIFPKYSRDPGEWLAWSKWMLEVADELEDFDHAIKLKSAHLRQAVADMPLEKYEIDPVIEEFLQETRATAQRFTALAQEKGILRNKKRFGLF